jgi:uncharacterized protein (TIGR02145 family)
MKKVLLCAAFIAASFTSIAQVGVGTTSPAGALDIVSTSSGLVLPRVANTDAVVNPNGGAIENGTMVYDLSTKCIKVYLDGFWSGCTQFELLTTQVKSDNSGGTYTFMAHNLGADTSLNPNIPQKGLNGDYYQWGKSAPDADVDNQIGSTWGDQGGTTDNGNWIPGVKGPKDPCPDGFRVPAAHEWNQVMAYNNHYRTGSFSDSSSNFSAALHFGPDASTKLLILPVPGIRYSTGGALNSRGEVGSYWSGTELSGVAYYLYFDSSRLKLDNTARTIGISVRCIAE